MFGIPFASFIMDFNALLHSIFVFFRYVYFRVLFLFNMYVPVKPALFLDYWAFGSSYES